MGGSAKTLTLAAVRTRKLRSLRGLSHLGRILDSLGDSGRALFDPDWYLRTYPDIAASGLDPLAHYALFGGSEGRDPCLLFSSKWYSDRCPEPLGKQNPLLHYVRHGARRGLDPHPLVSADHVAGQLGAASAGQYPGVLVWGDPRLQAHPLFDPAWYVARYPGSDVPGNPILDYLGGGYRNRDPHPLFDSGHYRSQRVVPSGVPPLIDYLEQVGEQLLDPHPLFHSKFYTDSVEVAPGIAPLVDYVTRGWQADASPHPLFDAGWYRRQYPQVIGPALADFLARADLSHQPNPVFDPVWYAGYLDPMPGAASRSAAGCLIDYLGSGHAEGRDPTSWFSTRWWAHRRGIPTAGALADFLQLPPAAGDLQPARQWFQAGGLTRCADASWTVGPPANSFPTLFYVEDLVPVSWAGAGYPRSVRVVRELAESGYDVVVLATCQGPTEFSWQEVRAELPAVTVIPDYSRRQVAHLLRTVAGLGDLIWVCRPENMTAMHDDWLGWHPSGVGAKLVWDTEALASQRGALRATLAAGPEADGGPASISSEQERLLAQSADAVIAVSPGDLMALRSAGVQHVLRVGHEIPARPPTASGAGQRQGVLFVGRLAELDSPNVDSIRWFAQSVAPLLPEQIVARVDAVGVTSDLVRADPDLARFLRGPQDDLGQYYEQARVFIAPTRFAAGVPLKVIEAAAAGVPVVASALIAGQLGWQPGREILVADTAQDFAAGVQRLLADDRLWETQRASALSRVVTDYGPGVLRSQVAAVLRLLDGPYGEGA